MTQETMDTRASAVARSSTTTPTRQDEDRQQGRGRDEASREEATLLPPVDVIEDATGITLHADLPGVAKDALDVRVDGETLVVEGRLGLAMPEGMSAHHAEVQSTRYRRTFTLSKELDPEKIDAEFVQGVLRLRIPKAADAQPRRVEVQVH